MKIFTQTYDLAKASPHRFWVAPFSEFKIGIKILEKDEISAKDFTLKAGSIEFTPDADKIDNFTLYTIKSNDTGFVEYTIEVEGVAEKLKLMQIVTDSTVFEIDASGGDVPADVATQTWVNSQISDFVEEDALTAYYTKSETSSATELAEAFAGAGGGSAISAFDMSENPVWSKTMVENAVKTDTCLPQTIVQYTDESISAYDVYGAITSSDIAPISTAKKILFGTNVTSLSNFKTGYNTTLIKIVVPSSISGLGLFSFESCKYLADVKLPSVMNDLGQQTFKGCPISSITIPNGVSYLPTRLLEGTVMKTLEFPNDVTRLGNFLFGNSPSKPEVLDFGNTRTSVASLDNTNSIPSNAKVYVPDALYDTWIAASNWSDIASQIHRHSELEAPYATSKAEDAWSMADATNNALALKVDHIAGGTAPEVMNITTYYESEYSQLSVDDPSWEPDMNTMYVILPDQV